MKKRPFLKGKLTKLSGALLVLAQAPNLLGNINEAVAVFAQTSAGPTSWISIIAAAGVFWGGIRRALNYKTPRLVIQAEPVE